VSARMRRLIMTARSLAGRDQVEKDARDRRLCVSPPAGHGLATLTALLPPADAVAFRAVLAALAGEPTDAGTNAPSSSAAATFSPLASPAW